MPFLDGPLRTTPTIYKAAIAWDGCGSDHPLTGPRAGHRRPGEQIHSSEGRVLSRKSESRRKKWEGEERDAPANHGGDEVMAIGEARGAAALTGGRRGDRDRAWQRNWWVVWAASFSVVFSFHAEDSDTGGPGFLCCHWIYGFEVGWWRLPKMN
jgi:hypothetical protein